MHKLKRSDAIFSLFLIVIGIVIICICLGYGVWDRIRPAKGFMPFLASSIMTICSLVWFIQCVTDKDATKEHVVTFSRTEFKWMAIVLLMILGVFFLMRWLGMIFSLAIFLLVWLRFISRLPWKSTILYTGIFTVIFYCVFVLGLKVPFPKFSLF